MTDVRGYDRDAHQRIERFVRRSERTAAPLKQPSKTPFPFKVRRVLLEGDLLLQEPTTGRERLPLADGSWVTTDIQIGNIFKDNPSLENLGEGDEVWLLPQGGKWYAIASAAIPVNDPARLGCCLSKSIPQSYLYIDGLYALDYDVYKIPSELGGPTVRLSHVGDTSGLPGITDGFPYWESDTFVFDCGGYSDEYLWRMVVGINPACRAGDGTDNVYLYLVNVGSGTACDDLAAPFCDDGFGTPALIQYVNIEDWRARTGSKLYMRSPQYLQEDLKRLLNCTVCVYPVATPVFVDCCPGKAMPQRFKMTITRTGTSCGSGCETLVVGGEFTLEHINTGTFGLMNPFTRWRYLNNSTLTQYALFCDTSGALSWEGTGHGDWRFSYANCGAATLYTNHPDSLGDLTLVSCDPLEIELTDIPCALIASAPDFTFDAVITEF